MSNVAADTPKEISLSQAFSMLSEEQYHDVSLQGNDDGAPIRASRIALSIRSPFFQAMFQKRFKEANQDVVQIGFSSPVLKAIVEYIHTDNASILNYDFSDGLVTDGVMATVESLLSLTEAAIYMGLPGLCDKLQMCLSRITVECPPMAWKILEASTQNGPVISKQLKNDALKPTRIRIRFNCPNLDVFHGIILGTISADTLMTVVDDLRKLAQTDDRSKGLDDCIGVCRLLKYWTDSPPSTGESKERRLNAAKHLMQCYELKLLRSDTLSVLFTAPKCEQRWKTQKSHIFATSKPKETDRLEGHVFALGETYQWTVKTRAVDLNGFGSSLWLGIAKSTATLSPRVSCEGLEDCWGVSGKRGTVWSDGVSTEFGSTAFFGMSGSRHAITMTLDLSVSNTDNGTLSVTVDDREPLVIASNLCKELKGTGVGYVPVVSADWQVVIIENVREL